MNENLKSKKLTLFLLTMVMITSIDSIRNLPGTTLLGLNIFYYVIIALIFYFIPIALVCAELTTMFPQEGGVYLWGKKAFGKNFGFIILWLQFVEKLIFYTPFLLFIVLTFMFPFFKPLTKNPYLIFIIINLLFWLFIVLNIYGIKISAIISSILGIIGIVIPLFLIVGIGIFIFFARSHGNITSEHIKKTSNIFSNHSFLFSITAIILSLTGIEVASVYVNEIEKPQKNFPKAILLSSIFIIVFYSVASFLMSNILKHPMANSVNGVAQFLILLFSNLHIEWLGVLILILISVGGLATINNWIISPTKGLHVAAKDGFLSKLFIYKNKRNVPTKILILQGIIVSVLTIIFVVIPHLIIDMWILNIAMVQLYMLMYALIFICFIVIKYKYPNYKSNFKIPGGKIGMWLVTCLGISSSFFTIIISFKLYDILGIHNNNIIFLTFLLIVLIFVIPALLLLIYKESKSFKKLINK